MNKKLQVLFALAMIGACVFTALSIWLVLLG